MKNTFHYNPGHFIDWYSAFRLKNIYTYAMWQLRIIIEISSRKEPLGPIWSLPWGPGQHYSFNVLSLLCPDWWWVFWRWHFLQWFLPWCRPNLMAGVASAFSTEFLISCAIENSLLAKISETEACQFACQPEWAGFSSVEHVGPRQQKSFANKKIPFYIGALWAFSRHLPLLLNFSL